MTKKSGSIVGNPNLNLHSTLEIMATHLTVGGSIGFGLGILFDHRHLPAWREGWVLYNESNLSAYQFYVYPEIELLHLVVYVYLHLVDV